jgi:hypothetical protein
MTEAVRATLKYSFHFIEAEPHVQLKNCYRNQVGYERSVAITWCNMSFSTWKINTGRPLRKCKTINLRLPTKRN